MRQLITIGTITVCLIILNYFIPINFIFDTEKLSTHLFKISGESDIDSTVVILNIGDLKDFETVNKIDSIILQKPKSIGINLCDITKDSLLLAKYKNNSLVTILNCNAGKELSSSLIGGENASRFKTDNPDYFEIRLTNSWDKIQERGNDSELINYKGASNRFVTIDLEDVNSVSLQGKIVLIDYLGKTVPADIYYADIQEAGLFQIQYSAFIISTIINDEFINEGNFFLNALLIIVSVLLVYWILTIVPIKNVILLTIVAYVLLGLVNAGLFGLIFVLFNNGFYLRTNGLTSILVITTLYTCLSKIENQKRAV